MKKIKIDSKVIWKKEKNTLTRIKKIKLSTPSGENK